MAKYEFIDSQKNAPGNTNPVWKMCRWMAVSASGFYDWLSRPLSATAARRQVLAARIRHFFYEADGTYGYRRIHAVLAAEGTQCSPELVRSIMRQEDRRCRVRVGFRGDPERARLARHQVLLAHDAAHQLR